jgi:ATP-dependent Clp protease ATP-binding subunit ClpB
MTTNNLANNSRWPHWIKQVEQYLDVCSHFVISGNVRDSHLIPTADGDLFCSTVESLREALSSRQLDVLLVYDRIDGLRAEPEDCFPKLVEALGKEYVSQRSPGPISMADLAKLMAGLQLCRSMRVCLVIDYASRLTSHASDLSEIESEFFSHCLKLADTSQELRAPRGSADLLFNPVFWIAGAANDLPDWFVIGNERVKGVQIELPNRETRSHVSSRLVRDLTKFEELSEEQQLDARERFVDLTEGISLTGLLQIRTIARQAGISAQQIDDAVRCYKVGVPDNPWRQAHLRERLKDGEVEIGRSIKGQAVAIEKTLDILKRSVLGLSGAQAGTQGGRPRGILFFAGPTGVGKTELAKAVTKLIFGDEQAYTRFDMSEFSSEHSEARLIGAPPGYVGYDSGGELVNAVRHKPFSLILFDEIEKAHPRILDKFLQVLEDGRLTDGRGRTVFFSETVLVFTSNLGMYVQDERGERKQNVTLDCTYQEINDRMKAAISEHFRFELQRPELLNRFGDNIVVFDFIRKDVAHEIFDKMLLNILTRVQGELGIELSLANEVVDTARRYCTSDMTNGGRGIGNRLETVLINPLSREVFGSNLAHGEAAHVLSLDVSGSSIKIQLA